MSWVYRRPFDYRSRPTLFYLYRYAASAAGGSADLAISLSGTLTGVGQLAANCSLVIDSTGSASGAAQMTGSSSVQSDLAGTLTGQGVMVSAISLTFDLQAVGQVSSAYSPLRYRMPKRWVERGYDWHHYTNKLVVFPLNVSSDITASAAMAVDLFGVLNGAAAASGSAGMTLTLSGLLAGQGALAGSVPLSLELAGVLGGTQSGDMSGSADIALGVAGSLGGSGALVGVAGSQFVLTGTPTVPVAMFAVLGMQLEMTGSIFDANATFATPRILFRSRGRSSVRLNS